jgi:hypothetical protein
MMHFRGGYLALSAIALLAACKQRVPQDADQLSITAPGQIAGKWLATLTIGDGIAKYEAELLANTLKSFFSPSGAESTRLPLTSPTNPVGVRAKARLSLNLPHCVRASQPSEPIIRLHQPWLLLV